MRCKTCGREIPEERLVCPFCGQEVQMVPEYNSLNDVLENEVKGSIADATRPVRVADLREYQTETIRRKTSATRVLSPQELASIRANQGLENRETRQPAGDRTETVRTHTDTLYEAEEEVPSHTAGLPRRPGEVQGEQTAKKRRRMVLIGIGCGVVLLGVLGYLLYQNSYAGLVSKGEKALAAGELYQAKEYFQSAISKDATRASGYTGMAKTYVADEETEEAEDMFLKAAAAQPDNSDLYEAAIQFYLDIGETGRISEFLEGCNDSIRKALPEYISDAPEFSLPAGTYSEVQQVSLEGEGDIYYTTDGSEPTDQSIAYQEAILVEEGTTLIKAICVNEHNIPSLVESRTYKVELPVEDAPTVTPSTGQYSQATQIVIQVPTGYTAYYTLDGSTPSAASAMYTGPIDMPQGTTIFSAVLISQSGKMTQVTKRNYILEVSGE